MAQKCSREMDNFLFGQRVLRHQLRSILRYHGFRIFIFDHWKGFGRLEAIGSSNAYQITEYQILQKIIFCPISKIFAREVLNLEFYYLLPRQVWSHGLFNFQSHAFEASMPFYSNGSEIKGCGDIYWEGFIPNNNH